MVFDRASNRRWASARKRQRKFEVEEIVDRRSRRSILSRSIGRGRKREGGRRRVGESSPDVFALVSLGSKQGIDNHLEQGASVQELHDSFLSV